MRKLEHRKRLNNRPKVTQLVGLTPGAAARWCVTGSTQPNADQGSDLITSDMYTFTQMFVRSSYLSIFCDTENFRF